MGRPTLLLVPTGIERERLLEDGLAGAADVEVRLCGFGPVASAARTAAYLERTRPARVVLAGIAGTYLPERHPVGAALVFGSVALDGVGAGVGAGFLGPRELGFPQWPGDEETTAISDRVALAVPTAEEPARAALLLTVTAASADDREVSHRRARHPAAVAEDMEGFAVALACALARVPCAIVRGISNVAGDRAKERWDIPRALAAARRATRLVLADPTWGATTT